MGAVLHYRRVHRNNNASPTGAGHTADVRGGTVQPLLPLLPINVALSQGKRVLFAHTEFGAPVSSARAAGVGPFYCAGARVCNAYADDLSPSECFCLCVCG